MDIIASHLNLDFDSVASMIAAWKLYPDALLVLHDSQERNVREYLNLSGRRRHFRSCHHVDLAAVDRLILVDTRQRKRLGLLEQLLRDKAEVIVYDHHPPAPDDIKADREHVTALGATITLLLEELERRGIPISPDEATLYLTGIYEDTGALTYVTTTVRDVEAAARLLAHGARLDMVRNFMYRPLNQDQRELCNRLLGTLQTEMINGIPITIASAQADSYVGDVAMIAHKLRDVENIAVLFLVVAMEERVHVVARSRLASVPVGELLEPLGGGGHASAASACVVGMTLNEVVGFLQTTMREKIVPRQRARDIMSTPVRTVRERLTITEVKRLMLQFDHSGLPVTDETGRLRGIITHRDIDKALHHGFDHAPVKGYMTTRIASVEPATSLYTIQRMMLQHNVGRLPVIADGTLCGIVTRSDLLRGLYGGAAAARGVLVAPDVCGAARATESACRDLKQQLIAAYGEDIFHLLAEVGEEAYAAGMNAYLVGGMVRDLLLGEENIDLDIVVEGNAIDLGGRLAERWGSEVKSHQRFLTAKLTAPGGMQLDLATARTEYYEYPAALPVVRQDSLRRDLQRRDFSINAMAMALTPERLGALVDPFGGRADLQRRCLRVLYHHSFVDDPTRILRAINFINRFALTLDHDTERALCDAVDGDALKNVQPQRLRPEVIDLLSLPDALRVVTLLEQRRILPALHPALCLREEHRRLLPRMSDALPSFWIGERPRWFLHALALLAPLPEEVRHEIVVHFGFKRRNRDILLRSGDYRHDLQALSDTTALSVLYERLGDVDARYLLFLYLASPDPVRVKIADYAAALEKMTPLTRGEFLVQLGIPPGPQRRALLQELAALRMDGKVTSRAEEEAWLRARR